MRAFFIPSGMFAGREALGCHTAAERGGKTIDAKVPESVSTRQVATKAEVAEWQTQRIQNPPSLRA
jgi:hypothetical protein